MRIGLVENTQRLRQATRAIRHFMAEHNAAPAITPQRDPAVTDSVS